MIDFNNYKRLTEKTIGYFQYDLKGFNHKIGDFGDYDAFFAYSMAVKRLAELEDNIEKGLLVPRYSISQDWEYGWWCVYESDKQGAIISQCKTEEEARRKLEELRKGILKIGEKIDD